MISNKRLFLLYGLLFFVYGCIVPGRDVNFRPVDENETMHYGWEIHMILFPENKHHNSFLSISIPKMINDSPNETLYDARIVSFELIIGDTKYSVNNPNKEYITHTTIKRRYKTHTSDFLELVSDSSKEMSGPFLHVDSNIKFIYLNATISFKSKVTGEIEEKMFNIILKKEIDRWAFIFPMV